VHELWWWYRGQVEAFTDARIPKGWWYYGTFENGTPIAKSVRETYRHRQDLRAAFTAPRKAGSGSFFEWLEVEGPKG